MVVSFYNKISKYGLISHHYCSLVDQKSNLLKLYDPYGNTLYLPKNIFFDNLNYFEIYYFNNKVFGMPEIKTHLEFTDTWPVLKNNENVHTKKYEVMVEQDDIEVLINLI